MIAVNNYFPQWDLDHVVCDYASAGRSSAMNYLFHSSGHRTNRHDHADRLQVKTAR